MEDDLSLWWHKEENLIICDLCPHRCRIKEGQRGICQIRAHSPRGKMSLEGYGKISSIAEDPVEKKPLFHWHPGSTILSIGGIGCNMSCPYCQNWPIAHAFKSIKVIKKIPEDILEMACINKNRSVAFTYNEPVVNYEFIYRTSKLLQSNGIEVALVTNGQIMPDPLNKLVPFISAANIDIKGFSQSTYDKLGGHLNTTLDTILALSKSSVHIELTSLIVPGISDEEDEFEKMTDWIAENTPNAILHLSRYFPAWRWDKEPTETTLIDHFEHIASKKLPWVYQGNTDTDNSTYCPECGYRLIKRNGYLTEITGLGKSGECLRCKKETGIVI